MFYNVLMKKWLKFIVLVIVIAGIYCLSLYFKKDIIVGENKSEDLYKVVYVSDGDTVILAMNNEEVYVRLIGIDCPESKHPDESKNTQEGVKAAEYTRNLLENKWVYFEPGENTTTDKYGRTLGYLYLEDGTFVNLKIVQDGYAYVMTMENDQYADLFIEAYEEAVKENRGLWAQ